MSMQQTQLVPAATSLPAPIGNSVGESNDQQQYLTFSLGEEMFAIGILAIREIIEYGQLTVVPMTPAFIRGVINLRGAVVPVIDLSARFGRQAGSITKRTCIVIIETGSAEQRQQMGVVVDAVSEVLEIPASDIEPAPEFGTHIRADFISGMGKVNSRFVVLLDVHVVLALDEIAVVAAPKQSAMAAI